MSLLFYGLRFEERADLFRACYLRLQAIDRSDKDGLSKMNEYHALLAFYPNHADRDFETMLVSITKYSQPYNSNGPIPLGWETRIAVRARAGFEALIVVAAIAIPIFVFFHQ